MAPNSSSQQSSYLEEDLGLDQLGSQAEQQEHKEAAHGSRVLRHPLACNSDLSLSRALLVRCQDAVQERLVLGCVWSTMPVLGNL